VIDVLDGDCAVRSEFAGTGYDLASNQIWSAVRPHWIGNVTAYVYSSIVGNPLLPRGSGKRYNDTAYVSGNSSSIAQEFEISLRKDETSLITKYVGIASSEAFTDPQTTARNASSAAANMGFPALLRTNAEEWAQVMPLDSVDYYALQAQNFTDGWANKELVTLQILAITNPWHILSNTVSANAIKAAGYNTRLDIWSIAVGGLGSSAYAGWIFWDAEIWMAPGIVVTNPQAAKQIANYRRELFPQAQANLNDAYQGSTNTTRFTPGGAAYPWISGKFGNCTAAGPCFDYEYHLNGDIGLELYNWYVATGDTETFKNEFFPIYDAVAYFFAELVKRNTTTGKYELFNATDPVGLLFSGC
jgi:trehalose/maltose hydrolase-like predicted phosphorylase